MVILKEFLKYWKRIIIVIITLSLNVLGVLLIPRLTVNIINIGVLNRDIPYIINQGAIMLLVAFFSSSSMVISVKNSTYVAASFAADLRKILFEKSQALSIIQFEYFGPASLIVRATDDINQIQNTTRMGLRMMLRAPLMFIGAIIMAINTNRQLSIVFLISLPITMFVILLLGKTIFPVVNELRKSLDFINKIFRQRLTGIRVIRAFDKEIYEEVLFTKANRDHSDLLEKAGEYASIFIPLLTLVMDLTLVGIVFYGSNLIMQGKMLVGDIVGFIQYSNNIMHSFLFISMIFVQIPRAKASIDRVNEVINLKIDRIVSGNKKLEKIESIEFKNVCFKYPNLKDCFIKDLSFKAKKGDIIGIIGSTGSGKTTLANLLVRFYDIDGGEILINGIDIKEYDLKSLREKISYAEQKPSLISGTVLKNIAMGQEKTSKANIADALKIAQADFVFSRELGIDEGVDQKGKNFSGGQKQRISIARAVYKKPELYIIDDSFSALDYKTERAVRSNLFENTKDTIMMIITQRVTVAHDADQIILLDNGRMTGNGSHDELKRTSKQYREILESQGFEMGEQYA